ncbi:MAG: prolipoprotein diacylglyceryl transferase [Pirellula staleyi]
MSFWVRLAYAVVLLVSVMIAWGLIRTRQKRLELTRSQRTTVGVAAFMGAMIGSKIPFLGEQGWGAVLDGTAWFADGKTILGGIVGGYAGVEFAKWIFGIRTRTGDSFALPVAVAVGGGRIGCFIAGCCFGQVTEMPWGVGFPTAHDALGILRHPTQLYEVAFHLVAAIVLVIMDRKRWLVGNQLKAYLIAYLVYRFLSEWLRPESRLLLNLTIYQLVSIVLIAVLIGLWARDSLMETVE